MPYLLPIWLFWSGFIILSARQKSLDERAELAMKQDFKEVKQKPQRPKLKDIKPIKKHGDY